MDKDHRIDAPDNDSLRMVEQISDHSELSTMYPMAGQRWSGDLMTTSEREKKMDAEVQNITLSLRKKILAIGLLAVAPFILIAYFVVAWQALAEVIEPVLLVFPAMIVGGIVGYVCIRLFRRMYGIFYNHSLSATPFFVVHLTLLGLSLQTIIILTQPVQTTGLMTVSVVSAALLVSSVILSCIIIPLWTTPKLSGAAKLGFIVLLAVMLLALGLAALLS